MLMSNEHSTHLEKATFAGGCFWCMEKPFEELEGIDSVISGYTGGDLLNPTYADVSSGSSGHREVIQISFNPEKISYEKLLCFFWQQINPTDNEGQFVDRGYQYTSAIYYHDDKQHLLAKSSKEALDKQGKFDKPIVTELLPATVFYPAEEYHQDYSKKNPLRYRYYYWNSGREGYLNETWKETKCNIAQPAQFSKETLKARLTPLQYSVTQEEGTEPPFSNTYWDLKDEGIYVDIVSGEPLFSSIDKYDSKTGWPSFTKPLVHKNMVEKSDRRLFLPRIELRSKHADSHLGHLFNDGPPPGGLRYCINSAALRFVPKEQLKSEGLSEFIPLFLND